MRTDFLIVHASYKFQNEFFTPNRSYPAVLLLLEKLSFDTDRIAGLLKRFLPQLEYYRENRKEVEEQLSRLAPSLYSNSGKSEDDSQTSARGPLKRSTYMEDKDLAIKDLSMDQVAAYKVACEFLKKDRTWRTDWGIGPSNVNKNGKKLITLGGMYPIVSFNVAF